MKKLAIRKRSRFAAAAAGIGLVVASTACATESDNGDGSLVQPGQGNSQQEDDANASLVVNEPQAGETVTLPFELAVSSDVELGLIADQVPHMHVWFDDAMDQMMIIEGDGDLIDSAPDGATTLRVQVHTHDHQPISEVVEVPLTVEGGGDGGSQPDPPNDY